MRILITGAAGFIGFHVSRRLLDDGNEVIGFDNLGDYYDVSLKQARSLSLCVSQCLCPFLTVYVSLSVCVSQRVCVCISLSVRG